MRNLLEEFRGNHGIRHPTILGVREHVFTGRLFFEYSVILPTIDMFVSFCINLFYFILLQCVFAGIIYV
jgi:hypothetical protein